MQALFLLKRDNPLKKKFILISNDYFKEMYRIRKESTVYSYENAFKKNILPFFDTFYIDEINVSIINNWKENMEKNNSQLLQIAQIAVMESDDICRFDKLKILRMLMSQEDTQVYLENREENVNNG